MDGIIEMIVWFAIFVFVMSAIGAPLTKIAKASKLPNWAKLNPANAWGIVWFDSKLWLKKLIISFGQLILVCSYFFVNFILAIIIAAVKIFFKTLEGGAKKVIKSK